MSPAKLRLASSPSTATAAAALSLPSFSLELSRLGLDDVFQDPSAFPPLPDSIAFPQLPPLPPFLSPPPPRPPPEPRPDSAPDTPIAARPTAPPARAPAPAPAPSSPRLETLGPSGVPVPVLTPLVPDSILTTLTPLVSDPFPTSGTTIATTRPAAHGPSITGDGTTMAPTPSPAPAAPSPDAGSSHMYGDDGGEPAAVSGPASGMNGRTLTVILSTVLSVIAVSFIAAAFLCWRRSRRRRRGTGGAEKGAAIGGRRMFGRYATPIGDEEIESWKTSVINEKAETAATVAAAAPSGPASGAGGGAAAALGDAANTSAEPSSSELPSSLSRPQLATAPILALPPSAARAHAKSASMSSIKRPPPSVIVYHPPRASQDNVGGTSSAAGSTSSPLPSALISATAAAASSAAAGPVISRSIDLPPPLPLPQTPILARAPNSRPGLTDETVRGDVAFIAASTPPRRHPSRLTKHPRSPRHARSRSSRSSTSIGSSSHGWYGAGGGARASYGSSSPMIPGVHHPDLGIGGSIAGPAPPRASVDNYVRPFNGQSSAAAAAAPVYPGHRRRGYSVSATQTTPRMSLDDDYYSYSSYYSYSGSGLSPKPLIRRDDIGKAIG